MTDDREQLTDILDKSRKEVEERDAQRRAIKAGHPYLNLALIPIETEALELVPEAKAREAKVATIEYKASNVVLVANDDKEAPAQAIIKELESKGLKLKIFIVSLTSLQRAWDFYKYVLKKSAPITGKINIDKERIELLKEKLTKLDKVREEILNFDYKKFPTAQILEIVLGNPD